MKELRQWGFTKEVSTPARQWHGNSICSAPQRAISLGEVALGRGTFLGNDPKD